MAAIFNVTCQPHGLLINLEREALAFSVSTTRKRARRTQDERSAVTRATIVRAVVRIIESRGLASATTRAVALEAGVSRGAMQHHFPSHDDLILEIVSEELTQHLHFRWNTEVLRKKSLAQRIDLVLAHYYKVFSSPIFYAVIPVLINPEPTFRKRVQSRLIELQNAINNVWRNVFSDVPVSDEEVASMRRVAMGAIRGYSLRERYSEVGTWPTDAVMLRDMILLRLQQTPRGEKGRRTVRSGRKPG